MYKFSKLIASVLVVFLVALAGLLDLVSPVRADTTIALDAPLRCVSNVCDYIDYANQQVVRNIGYIASYAGETITTPHMSTTGELTTGATVQYQLTTPTYESVILPAVAVPAGDTSVTGLGGNNINASQITVDYASSGAAIWDPSAPVPWKTTAETQLFTLESATDLGGAGLTAATYSCTAAAENGASCSATVTDNVGNTAQCLSPTNRIDLGYPADGFITYASASFTNLTSTVSVTVDDGTSLSGINTTTRQLMRRFAPMVSDGSTVSCGTYGAWAATTYTGTYPNLTANAAFVDENCYQYGWSVDNNVGRNTVYENANVIQVVEPIVVNITNPDTQLIATSDGGLTISGTIGKAKAKTVTVSTTIAGAPKSTTISAGDTAWTLHWTFAELTPGTYTGNKIISATDTIVTGTAAYTGTIIVDKDSPVNQSISVVEGTNPEYQYQTGNQIYYNSKYTGGFRVIVVPGTTPSGVKAVTFPALGTGFTPTAATVTTVSPYAVDYAWTTAATISPDSENATTTYGNDLTTTSAFVVTRDVTAPDATLTYSTGYITNLSTQPQMSFTESDSGSGINVASRKLQRASATLANNVCGAYGSFADTTFSVSGGNITDTAAISDATCYKYQYIIADNVSNSTTVTSSAEFKVDTTAPLTTIASVTVSGGNTYYNAGTKVVYYKIPSNDNTYTVNVDASDLQSGIARVVFPGAGVTGFSPASAQTVTTAPYKQLYTIAPAATSTAPGTQTVTGYNNAELSTNAAYTVTYDNVAPVGNSVTCPSEYSITGNYNITGVVGTDAASGVNTSASYFQVASATLAGNTCGTFGSFANTGSAGAVNLQQNPMSNGCYQYRYSTVDNVGNVATSTTCTIKVDTVPPTCGITWTPSTPVAWKTVAATQNFVLTGSSDAETGMTANSYSCTAAAVNGATCNATIADNAGNTAACTSPANRIDDQPPQGGYINYDSSTQMQLESTISATVADGNISISGVNTTTRQLWRRSAALSSADGTCGTYSAWALTTYTGTYPNLLMNEAFVGGTCYQYQWSVASNAGLTAYYTNTNEIKVLANAVPGIAFDNPSDTVIATVDNGLTLSGTVADGDSGQTLTVDMTIQNVAKQTQISTPADNTPWSFNWTWAELPESQVLTNTSATVFDGVDGWNIAYHPGQVIIDKLAPTITVSPAPQNSETQQTIVVEATTGASGLARFAFLWDSPLNSTCTNGRSVLSGADIGSTQPDGNHTLYLCAISNAGVISTKNVSYGYTPAPLIPILERQVEAKDLYWNALALDPQSDSFTLDGRYDATGAVYRYNLQLQIRNAQGSIQALKTLNVRTSTTASTDFSFVIPMSDLNLSKTNSSFPGPMILTITDLETLQITTVNWNLGLYVPLYQLDHLVNSGANYIRVYSSQTAQVPTLQNFTQSTCDSWPVVSGNNWSNAYGSSADNANLASYYLSDSRSGTLYEVRKFSDGNCWLVDNLSYGGCTTSSWGDSNTQAYCRSNPANPAYGYLYNFVAAQSACPNGWSLPTNDQLTALFGKTSNAPAWKNVYAGQVNGAGTLTDQGLQAYYWTQTAASDTLGVALNFASGQNSQVISNAKNTGLSIMCVK